MGVDIDEAIQLSPHHHSSDIWHLGYFHTAGVKSKILGLIPWLCSGPASKSCLVSRTCTLFSFNACPYDFYHISVGNAGTISFLFSHTNY